MINGNGYNNFYSNTMINGKTDFDDISSQQLSELKMMDSPMFSSLVRSVLFSSLLFTCSFSSVPLFILQGSSTTREGTRRNGREGI